MRLIKITKYLSARSFDHYVVIYDDSKTVSEIDEIVEDWGQSNPSGSNNGYNLNWSFIEDEKLIEDSFLKELKRILLDIDELQKKEIELYTYFKSIKVKDVES